MLALIKKRVLVIGLDVSGRAACELLCGRCAGLLAIDRADTQELRGAAASLRALGSDISLGVSGLPEVPFDLAVLSPVAQSYTDLVEALTKRAVPLISDLELAFLEFKCLTIAIAGA